MSIYEQFFLLFLFAIPVACISWTVTNEEVFREPRDYCLKKSKDGKTILARKFFYLFTCQYCFSHYVTVAILLLTGYKLVYSDWRGYIISGFSLVWVSNIYMSLLGLLRQDIAKEKLEIKVLDEVQKNEPTK
jgi:hypothetical protein